MSNMTASPQKEQKEIGLKSIWIFCFKEQLSNGFEAGPIVRPYSEKLSSDLKDDFEKVTSKFTKNTILFGYDYLVMRITLDGKDIDVFPGDIIFLHKDNNISIIHGFKNKEIADLLISVQ